MVPQSPTRKMRRLQAAKEGFSSAGRAGGASSKGRHVKRSLSASLGMDFAERPRTNDELASVIGSWADHRLGQHTSYVRGEVERALQAYQADAPPHIGCRVVVGGSSSFGGLEGTVIGTDRERLVVRLDSVDDDGEPIMVTLQQDSLAKVREPEPQRVLHTPSPPARPLTLLPPRARCVCFPMVSAVPPCVEIPPPPSLTLSLPPSRLVSPLHVIPPSSSHVPVLNPPPHRS